mmetsp:Transcript_79616/g.155802  ORF Transcript_79616/g.155802 Transcript_79616/m.155802 type:complete len:242 (-) Transcript_79616:666-1391(-)
MLRPSAVATATALLSSRTCSCAALPSAAHWPAFSSALSLACCARFEASSAAPARSNKADSAVAHAAARARPSSCRLRIWRSKGEVVSCTSAAMPSERCVASCHRRRMSATSCRSASSLKLASCSVLVKRSSSCLCVACSKSSRTLSSRFTSSTALRASSPFPNWLRSDSASAVSACSPRFCSFSHAHALSKATRKSASPSLACRSSASTLESLSLEAWLTACMACRDLLVSPTFDWCADSS